MKRGVLILVFLIFLLPSIYAFCGDGLVDPTENCKTCPEDNPCFVDSKCVEDKCIPRIVPPLFLKTDPSATIIIPQHIADSLNTKFKQDIEFVSCLKGKYADGIYQITKEIEPKIIADSPFHIEHAGCPKIGTIATIHSHVTGLCDPSQGDLFSFGRKNEPFMAITCGENNYAFFSRDLPDQRSSYLIRQIPEKENAYFLFLLPWIFSLILIFILAIYIVYKHKVVENNNEEVALHFLEEFNQRERKTLNLLIEYGELPKQNIPHSLLLKLRKRNLVKTKGNLIKLEKWFRNALKKL